MTRYVGSGRYGIVGAAQHTITKQHVVVKQVRNVFRMKEGIVYTMRTLREIAAMISMNHPNVVRLIDILQPPADRSTYKHVYAVMEDVNGLDLRHLLGKRDDVLSKEQVRFLAYQVVCGVSYMYDIGMMHRDLKPENILVRWDCVAKISDFGFARNELTPEQRKEVQDDMAKDIAEHPEPKEDTKEDGGVPKSEFVRKQYRRLSTHVVTRWYRAPEMLLADPLYDISTDIWSTGCILGELMMLQHKEKRSPLFTAVCSRLSPTATMDRKEVPCPQFEAVAAVLGVPEAGTFEVEEMNWQTKEYLDGLRANPGEVASLEEKYAHWDVEDVGFVKNVLQWDPRKRPKPQQILDHEYFDDIRNKPELYGNIAEHHVSLTPATKFTSMCEEIMTRHSAKQFLAAANVTESELEKDLDDLFEYFWTMPHESSSQRGWVLPSKDLAIVLAEDAKKNQDIFGFDIEKMVLDPLDLRHRMRSWVEVENVMIKFYFDNRANGFQETKERKAHMAGVKKILMSDVSGEEMREAMKNDLGYETSRIRPEMLQMLAKDALANEVDFNSLYGDVDVHVKKLLKQEEEQKQELEGASASDAVVRDAAKAQIIDQKAASSQSSCCVVL